MASSNAARKAAPWVPAFSRSIRAPTNIGARVALKVISSGSIDSETTERFFAEARAVNLIHHERIRSGGRFCQTPTTRDPSQLLVVSRCKQHYAN